MLDNRKDLITFIEEFSNLINPPYTPPYITETILTKFETELGHSLPVSFRDLVLLCNFDDFQLGTTSFGDGSSSYLDYLIKINVNSGECLKIARGEIGGIFISLQTGEIWSQFKDGEVISQNKLADDFEKFLAGYIFLQKNRMEKALSLEEATEIIAKQIGSDDHRVWLHSIL